MKSLPVSISWFLCLVAVFVANPSKVAGQDQTKSTPSPVPVQTNEIPLKLRIETEPPQKVTVPVDFSAGQGPSTVIVPVKLKAEEPPVAELKISIKASTQSPDPILVPVKIGPQLQESAPPLLVSSSNWTGWLPWIRDHLVPYVGFPFFLILLGGVGGLTKRHFARKDLVKLKSETVVIETAWKYFVYGMTAAMLMPFLLYLVRGDIFKSGFDNALIIVLASAGFAAGFLGAELLRYFDRIILRSLGAPL